MKKYSKDFKKVPENLSENIKLFNYALKKESAAWYVQLSKSKSYLDSSIHQKINFKHSFVNMPFFSIINTLIYLNEKTKSK